MIALEREMMNKALDEISKKNNINVFELVGMINNGLYVKSIKDVFTGKVA